MAHPEPRRAPARASAPALKLWIGHADADSELARLLVVAPGTTVTVYLCSATKLGALDLLGERFSGVSTGRDIEGALVGGGPEIAQAMHRDDAQAFAEDRAYAVHGTCVVEVDGDGQVYGAGRYHHERRRYVPATKADRLVEALDVAEATLRRGRRSGALTEGDERVWTTILDAARERQMQLRHAERGGADGPEPGAYEVCLADADETP